MGILAGCRAACAVEFGAGDWSAGRSAGPESLVKADWPSEEAATDVADLGRLLSRKENARADAEKTQ